MRDDSSSPYFPEAQWQCHAIAGSARPGPSPRGIHTGISGFNPLALLLPNTYSEIMKISCSTLGKVNRPTMFFYLAVATRLG